MARTRNLKPGFFKNENLAALGMPAMILFEGLWTIADREGRLEDRPLRIRAEIFPYFPDQPVDQLLDSLAAAGFIIRYTVEENRFIAIPTWSKHQNPHIKETPSTIPAPDKNSASTVLAPDKNSSSRASLLFPSLLFSSSHGSGNPERDAALAAFHGWFATYPNPVRETTAREAWRRLVDSGEIRIESVPDVVAGTERWRTSKEWTKDDGQWIPAPATFLTGNDKHGGRLWKEHPPQVPSTEHPPSSDGVDPYAEWVPPEHWKNFKK
jgi:hypothetical protein